MVKKRRKPASGQSPMFNYIDATEKLYCVFCHGEYEIVEEQEHLVKLACGHLTVRDASEIK